MDRLLESIHRDLGIEAAHLANNRLSKSEQPPLEDIEVVDFDFQGRPFLLVSSAARAWREMTKAALEDGIQLKPFSGFRSYALQKFLIETHLAKGRALEAILTHIAIPGYSEHHTGRAVDIHAEGNPVLEEAFEQTEAFAWLTKNAARFQFRLSYPRGNDFGIIYEPWHWYYTGK